MNTIYNTNIHHHMRALRFENILTSKGWIYLGAGKDRRVWKRGNVVIKIAFAESGITANRYERKIYRQSIGKKQEVKYAHCRLVSQYVLMMRAVKELDYIKDEALIPKWAYQLNDGPQVGMDRYGVVMVFDYADEVRSWNK